MLKKFIFTVSSLILMVLPIRSMAAPPPDSFTLEFYHSQLFLTNCQVNRSEKKSNTDVQTSHYQNGELKSITLSVLPGQGLGSGVQGSITCISSTINSPVDINIFMPSTLFQQTPEYSINVADWGINVTPTVTRTKANELLVKKAFGQFVL